MALGLRVIAGIGILVIWGFIFVFAWALGSGHRLLEAIPWVALITAVMAGFMASFGLWEKAKQ